MMPNIKIQRAGPDVPGHRFEFLPAADLGVSRMTGNTAQPDRVVSQDPLR